ncbi:MAG: glycosyltransferase family 2 protein [Planctomycetota bacterium]
MDTAGRSTRPDDLLSIIVPAYNEQDTVLALARSVAAVMAEMRRPYELLFIDDGSTDATCERILEACALDPSVQLIRLKRNFGQTAAMAAGFDYARGKHVVTLDADLQNDPRDIPKIVARLEEGYDMVNGWRRNRKDRFLTRRLPSLMANYVLSRLMGAPVHDFGCTLKGYRATFIKSIPIYADMHRYIPALAAAVGAKITEIEVMHHPRRFGRSKYGMSRTIKVLLDMTALQLLLKFSARPLHWFGWLAIPVFLITAFSLLVGFIDHESLLRHGELRWIEHSTVVFPAIGILGFFLVGSLLTFGLLCELVNRVGEGSFSTLYTEERPAGDHPE